MKIKAIAATTFKDAENGWSYSRSALASLAQSAESKPVVYQKRRIGIVESGKCEGDKVVITASINTTDNLLDKKLFLVPGGLTDFDTKGDILEKCIAHQFFVTEDPSDKTLTALEIITP